MKYYAELANGERKPITDWVYLALTQVHGWVHVLRDANLEVVKKL